MPRPKKSSTQAKRGRPKLERMDQPKQLDKAIVNVQVEDVLDLSTLPLNTVEDYRKYNEEARKQKKPIKFCPNEFYPMEKIKFRRVDNQKGSSTKIRFRSGKYLIDFHAEIEDGAVVSLPRPVVEYLNTRQVDKYKQIKRPDGSSETVYSHSDPRFSCQPVYEELDA
jgi:hypothetical protein